MEKTQISNTQNTAQQTWHDIIELADRETLTRLALRDVPLPVIAAELNCTRYQIMRALKHHGIDRKQLRMAKKLKKSAASPKTICIEHAGKRKI